MKRYRIFYESHHLSDAPPRSDDCWVAEAENIHDLVRRECCDGWILQESAAGPCKSSGSWYYANPKGRGDVYEHFIIDEFAARSA